MQQTTNPSLATGVSAPRRVHLMGLPVDCVTEAQAIAICQDAIARRRQVCIDKLE